MPAKTYRIPGCQNNPVLSRNAANNILAVLNATITLRTTMMPVNIQKLRFCTWPAQCHDHTRIEVVCTKPRNIPSQSASGPAWVAHTVPAMPPAFNLYIAFKIMFAGL